MKKQKLCILRKKKYFQKRIRYSKNKQGIVEVQINYQMKKNAMFYLQICDMWNLIKNTNILS